MGRRRRTLLQVILAVGGEPRWWVTVLLALGTYVILHQFAVGDPAAAAPGGTPGGIWANGLRQVALYAQYIVPWLLIVGLLTSVIRRAAHAQLAEHNARARRKWLEEPTAAPTCPRCRGRMVRRTAQQGRNAGRDFWGCSRFPACHGTLELEAEERYSLSA